MTGLTLTGLIIGILGSSASAIGSSNLFLTNEGEANAKNRADGPDDSRSAIRHRKSLALKAWIRDKLTLIGASFGILGSILALIGF